MGVLNQTVYAVKYRWEKGDIMSTDIDLYSSYDKAITAFNRDVAEEVERHWNGVINKDGTVQRGYSMVSAEGHFEICRIGEGTEVAVITVEKLEVK